MWTENLDSAIVCLPIFDQIITLGVAMSNKNSVKIYSAGPRGLCRVRAAEMVGLCEATPDLLSQGLSRGLSQGLSRGLSQGLSQGLSHGGVIWNPDHMV